MSTDYIFTPAEMLQSAARWCLNNPGGELLLTFPQMLSFATLDEVRQWSARASLKLRECADGWRFCFGERPPHEPPDLDVRGNKFRRMVGLEPLKGGSK